MKEDTRPGWEWKTAGDGGYWVKMKSKGRHVNKLPFFCPYEDCMKKITGTIDDESLLKNGVCQTCYVMYVEGRKKPLIDVDLYRERLKRRGY